MFDPTRRRIQRMDLPPEAPLASDLEWMLQSGQGSRSWLAEALVREYYAQARRLATGLLGSPQAGREAALEAVTAAVAQARRYRSGNEVEAWFFGLAWKCLLKSERRRRAPQESPQTGADGMPPETENAQQAALRAGLQSLPPEDRLLVLLQALLGWDAAQIGKAVGIPSAVAASRLSVHYDRLMQGRAAPEAVSDPQAWLGEQIASLFPAVEMEEGEVELAVQAVLARSIGVTWLRGNSTAFNEVILLGFVLALVILVFFGASRLAAEPPEAAIPPAILTQAARQPPASPTRTPFPTRRPTYPPLPTPTLTPTPEGIFYNGHAGQVYSSVASILGVELGELRRLNRIPEDKTYYDGQPLLIPGRLPQVTYAVPTPVPPYTATRSLPVPQPGENVLSILATDQMSMDTLWVDALVLARYGTQQQPTPIAWRVQLWFSMEHVLMISGPVGSNPSLVILWSQNESYVARPAAGNLWFERFDQIADLESELLPFMGVAALFEYYDGANTRLEFVAQERLLDRDVWVVDETNDQEGQSRRRWVDIHSGLSLRLKNLSGPVHVFGSQSADSPDEVAVQSVQYNADFPPDLFDASLPWRGGYASDASGEPVQISAPPLVWVSLPQPGELKREPLPPDLNLARSRLLMLNRFDASAPQPRTEIYADGYFLGSAPFHNPWRLWCQRAPDGLKLAYTDPTSWYIDFPVSISGLYWLDLRQPEQTHPVFPEQALTSGSFAFSPDSRWLAYWACVPGTERCGVYAHDTETGENRLLLKKEARMTGFAWSPDGTLLAAASDANQLFTMRLDDARLMHVMNDYRIGEPAPALSPPGEWGMVYPPLMGDLADCAIPP